VYRLEIYWAGLGFYGRHGSLDELFPLIEKLFREGEFFTLKAIS